MSGIPDRGAPVELPRESRTSGVTTRRQTRLNASGELLQLSDTKLKSARSLKAAAQPRAAQGGRFRSYGSLQPGPGQQLSALRTQPWFQTAPQAFLEKQLLRQMSRVYKAALLEAGAAEARAQGVRGAAPVQDCPEAAGPSSATPVPGPSSLLPEVPEQPGPEQQVPKVLKVTPKFWDVPRDPESLRQSIQALLDKVGGLLCKEARVRKALRYNPETEEEEVVEQELSGLAALSAPLTHQGSQVPGQQPGASACMLLDKTKVAETRHVWQEKESGNYLRIKLAMVQEEEGSARPSPVCEFAHRLVLWAMHGPPPKKITDEGVRIVAMHICHNSMCISPSHLVWGKDAKNLGREADAHVMEMLTEQLRTIL